MLSIILDRYVKNPKVHNMLIRYGFFIFNGMATGIVFNDILRMFYGDFRDKHMVGYALGGAAAISGFVDKRLTIFSDPTNNMVFGSGFLLGNYWANKSEKGEKIA